MPCPGTKTSVLAVPRSTARSLGKNRASAPAPAFDRRALRRSEIGGRQRGGAGPCSARGHATSMPQDQSLTGGRFALWKAPGMTLYLRGLYGLDDEPSSKAVQDLHGGSVTFTGPGCVICSHRLNERAPEKLQQAELMWSGARFGGGHGRMTPCQRASTPLVLIFSTALPGRKTAPRPSTELALRTRLPGHRHRQPAAALLRGRSRSGARRRLPRRRGHARRSVPADEVHLPRRVRTTGCPTTPRPTCPPRSRSRWRARSSTSGPTTSTATCCTARRSRPRLDRRRRGGLGRDGEGARCRSHTPSRREQRRRCGISSR